MHGFRHFDVKLNPFVGTVSRLAAPFRVLAFQGPLMQMCVVPTPSIEDVTCDTS